MTEKGTGTRLRQRHAAQDWFPRRGAVDVARAGLDQDQKV